MCWYFLFYTVPSVLVAFQNLEWIAIFILHIVILFCSDIFPSAFFVPQLDIGAGSYLWLDTIYSAKYFFNLQTTSFLFNEVYAFSIHPALCPVCMPLLQNNHSCHKGFMVLHHFWQIFCWTVLFLETACMLHKQHLLIWNSAHGCDESIIGV